MCRLPLSPANFEKETADRYLRAFEHDKSGRKFDQILRADQVAVPSDDKTMEPDHETSGID
jgi:hypothetical protein